MKKDIILNLILTLLSNVLIFFQNKYFINYLGIETLGLIKLFTQILAYLNIVEMGIGTASTFALYKPLVEKDYVKVSIIVNTINSIYNKIAMIILILGMCCTPFITFFIKEYEANIHIYWILYVINTVMTYFYVKYIILFTANQEFIYVRCIQTLTKCIFQLLQIFFIVKYKSIYIYIGLLLLTNLFQWICFKLHYINKYNYIIATKEKFINIKNDIKNLFWHKIGGLVVFNTDLLLISKLVSLEIVGIYASYQMIFYILTIVVGILTSALSPRIGRFIAAHNKNEVYMKFKKLDVVYCFIGIYLICCTYSLIDSFLMLWLGKNVILPKFTLKLMCINLFINLFRDNLGIFKEGFGFFEDISLPIFESGINLLISIILGLKLGLDGIIIGTICSNIIVILIWRPILVFKKCFNVGIKEYIAVYGNYALIIVLCLLILQLANRNINNSEINSWFEWIMLGLKNSIFYFIIISAIFMLNKYFRMNILLFFRNFLIYKNNGEDL